MGNAVDRNDEVFAFVPSYNHAPFVEECLRSIFAQTRPPGKLLVIDDGSRDGSPEIIERVLKDCPFPCQLIVRENRGLCRTLNQALELSEGEYFAYIGSDDLWLPDFLKARTESLRARPEAVLGFGNCYLIRRDGTVAGSTADNNETQMAYRGPAKDMLLSGMAPLSPTLMYRRSALGYEAWNPAAQLEDYEMYLKLVDEGEFVFDPSVLSAWREHGQNTSRDRAMMLDELLEAQRRNAGKLGLDEMGLEAAAVSTTFRYARIALQDGDKRAARSLARASWRGAASSGQLALFGLRLMLPLRLVEKLKSTRKNP